MAIRTRLLLLLLGTALAPLAVASLSHHISLRIARQRLTTQSREALDKTAKAALQEQLRGYVEVLLREKRLVQSLLQRQAREIELALAGVAPAQTGSIKGSMFGLHPELEMKDDQIHPCFRNANDPNTTALPVDYQCQVFRKMPWAKDSDLGPVINTMAPLTSVYHDIYQQAPEGTLWLTTQLHSGLSIRYPATQLPELPPRPTRPPRLQGPPRGGDPRRESGRRGPGRTGPRGRFGGQQAPWGRSEKPGGGPRPKRNPLIMDPLTDQPTVVISVPLHDPEGNQIGTTGLIRTIPEIFNSLALPERWGAGIQRMIVHVDPNQTEEPSARIILHDNLEMPERQFRGRPKPKPLVSTDEDAFQQMSNDISSGTAGIRKMDYKGSPHLWAYHPLDVQDAAALLIVPYERVTELARTMEASLLSGSLGALEITSVVFLLAAVIAVFLAIARAKCMTRPIAALIEAGQRLSQGDYEARVDINTGDELEQLGAVFNQTGPKLREHERMKSTLALAGAVQQSLLPKQTPSLRHFDLAGQALFCDETGGDCFDYIDLSAMARDRHGIVLGDVSGHGLSAALLMAAIRGSIRSEAKHHSHDLSELLVELNRQFVQDSEDDKFATLFYGILDDPGRSLTWAAAGHEPALWYHHETKTVEELHNTGMPIGVLDNATYDQAGPIHLASNDILIMGTDGIREAQNPAGELFGRERFHEIIRDHAHENAEAICAAVIQKTIAFVGPASRTDDITLVVVKCR